MQSPSKIFEDGQALNALTAGIMKQTDGIVATAIPDVDYATAETLQELVDEAEGYRDQAQQSASDASTSATNASNSASDASSSATSASISSAGASVSATEAGLAAATATSAAATATTAAATATGFAAAAATSAGIAGTASETARGYSDAAEGYANDAENFATNSQNSATNSYTYLQQLLTTGFTFTGDVTGAGVLSSPIPLSLALTLNQIKTPTAPIDVDDFKIVNLADPVNPTDAVNYRTLISYVGGTENLTLVGDGTAAGPLSGPITFTLTKTLNNITNAGDLSLAGYKITNLALPMLPTDGVNKFYVDSHTWTSSQITDFTSAVQSNPVNTLAAATGNLNMNGYSINNVANPVNPTDGVNKQYVDTSFSGGTLTLTGAVTGSGSLTSPVVTTLTPITTSQITDFISAVESFSLDQFAQPQTDLSMNGHRLRDMADPEFTQDASTMRYVDNHTWLSASITDLATTVQAYPLNYFAQPTDNLSMNGHLLRDMADPQFTQDAATMRYVDNHTWTSSQITDLYSYITTIPLNNFLQPDDVIDMNSQRIADVGDPVDYADAANRRFVDNHTWLTASITDFYSNVTSIPLNNMLQPDDVIDMNSQRIADVGDPLYATDAVNAGYVYNQIQNIPVNRSLTSSTYSNTFTFSNTCIPTYAAAVSNTESFINVYGGGYAFVHANYSGDTTQIGEFDFNIVNTDSSYTTLMTFSESGGVPEIVIDTNTIFTGGLVDFSGTSIYVNNPIDGAQAASKAYVDSSLSAFRSVTSSTSSNLFSLTNTFTPASSNPSTNTETFINAYGAGYEFIHQTLSTDSSQIGTFAFNAIGPTSGGNTVYPLMTASYFGAEQLVFACPIEFNGQVTFATSVTVQTPTTAGNPATKTYVDTTTPYVLRPSGCIYFQANATGASASANTWLKMVGTTTSSQLNLFTTTVNNQLKYSGTTGITANIITNASIEVSSTSATTVSVAIYKNGTRWAPSINSGQTTAATTPIRLSVNAQIPLVTNDYIEVWYESSVATTITATYMSTTINPV